MRAIGAIEAMATAVFGPSESIPSLVILSPRHKTGHNRPVAAEVSIPSGADKPNQLTLFGLNAFCRQSAFPAKNLIDHPFLFRIVDEKSNPPSGVDKRIGKSNSMVFELRNEVAHHIALSLFQSRGTGKERSGVTVITQTQQD